MPNTVDRTSGMAQGRRRHDENPAGLLPQPEDLLRIQRVVPQMKLSDPLLDYVQALLDESDEDPDVVALVVAMRRFATFL